MNILSMNDYSLQLLYTLKDKVLNALSPLQKKVLAFALVAFSALAVLCFVSYKIMNGQRKVSQDSEDDLEGLNKAILNEKREKPNEPKITIPIEDEKEILSRPSTPLNQKRDDLEELENPVFDEKIEQADESKIPSQIEDQKQILSNPFPLSFNSKETRLQQLLENSLAQHSTDSEVASTIVKLLPELEGSVLLSDDELVILGSSLGEIDPAFLRRHFSPGLLGCIVRNSILNSNFASLLAIMKVIAYEPLDRQQLSAFAFGFDPNQNHAIYPGLIPSKEIQPKQITTFLYGFSSIIDIFKTHLSDDEMKGLIKNICELVVAQISDNNKEKAHNFVTAWCLSDKLGDQYTQIVLDALCRVKSPTVLAEIFICTGNDTALIIKTILKLNPPKRNDPNDTFFQQFIDSLKDYQCANIAECVFKNASLTRKQILASRLSPTLIAVYIEHIPVQILENMTDSTFLAVATGVIINHYLASNQVLNHQTLQSFAQAIKPNQLYDLIKQNPSNKDFVALLLPLCPFNTQVQFVSKVLDSNSFYHQLCLQQTQVQLNVWEEASKQNPTRKFMFSHFVFYSPESYAHIVNGQIHNQKFLKDFFRHFFDEKKDLERQKACLVYLQPEVFEFDKPEEVESHIWCQFFKALREMTDQTQSESLLIKSTLHLFNSPDFQYIYKKDFYALTKKQMELLPISQYTKPEIRLILASITNQFDDDLIKTANSLDDLQGGDFFYFFNPAYLYDKNYDFVFKNDIQYLKNFLLWILNRPSIAPVLPTWNWVNEHYAKDMLLIEEIRKDQDIQGHINRLHLKVGHK